METNTANTAATIPTTSTALTVENHCQRNAGQRRHNDKVSYHAENAGGAHGKDTNDK